MLIVFVSRQGQLPGVVGGHEGVARNQEKGRGCCGPHELIVIGCLFVSVGVNNWPDCQLSVTACALAHAAHRQNAQSSHLKLQVSPQQNEMETAAEESASEQALLP